MEKIAFVGKVVSRNDYGTRVVLTLINKAQDKLTLSYFKQDQYTPPEVLETYSAIDVGTTGTFYYAIKGQFKNLKGFDPGEQGEGELPSELEPRKPQGSSQVDPKNRAFALSYAKDSWVGGRVETKEQMFQLAEEMVMFLCGPISDENGN